MKYRRNSSNFSSICRFVAGAKRAKIMITEQSCLKWAAILTSSYVMNIPTMLRSFTCLFVNCFTSGIYQPLRERVQEWRTRRLRSPVTRIQTLISSEFKRRWRKLPLRQRQLVRLITCYCQPCYLSSQPLCVTYSDVCLRSCM
jgi:hypothetical protein